MSRHKSDCSLSCNYASIIRQGIKVEQPPVRSDSIVATSPRARIATSRRDLYRLATGTRSDNPPNIQTTVALKRMRYRLKWPEMNLSAGHHPAAARTTKNGCTRMMHDSRIKVSLKRHHCLRYGSIKTSVCFERPTKFCSLRQSKLTMKTKVSTVHIVSPAHVHPFYQNMAIDTDLVDLQIDRGRGTSDLIVRQGLLCNVFVQSNLI